MASARDAAEVAQAATVSAALARVAAEVVQVAPVSAVLVRDAVVPASEW